MSLPCGGVGITCSVSHFHRRYLGQNHPNGNAVVPYGDGGGNFPIVGELSLIHIFGGCVGTACTLVGQKFDIPVLGTMAHSWVQLFDNELDAFRAYAREYPDQCTLLVDTYNVLKSGIPNAIRVFNEELLPRGYRPKGIRIEDVYKRQPSFMRYSGTSFPSSDIIYARSIPLQTKISPLHSCSPR